MNITVSETVDMKIQTQIQTQGSYRCGSFIASYVDRVGHISFVITLFVLVRVVL
jgi:hypothetical protein